MTMREPQHEWLLRIFLGESDRLDHQSLYEWLVLEARKQGLRGATVLRGTMGYGAGSQVHSFKIERLSLDLPIVVEIVETRERLDAFLAAVTPALTTTDGIVTLERVEVRRFGSRSQP